MSLQDAHQHFQRVDPILFQFLQGTTVRPLPQAVGKDEYFTRLCSDIIGQQLSGKVADVIEARFRQLFPDQKPTAAAITAIPEQKLRDVGMSWAKVRSVKDLAEKTLRREINWDSLSDANEEMVIEELIKVKGIGRWTAEMFLLFTLGRENIFSFGDLGLKKGLIKMYALPADVSRTQIESIIQPWSPYRSYASLALWRALEI